MSRSSRAKARHATASSRANGAVAARQPSLAKSRKTQRLFIAASLLALSFLPYVNSLQNGFVWDDHKQVVMNPAVRPDQPLRSVFAAGWGFTPEGDSHIANDYRPFAFATYRLTAEVFGFDPAAFHGVSLALNSVCVLLVFALFLQLSEREGVAFAAAAFFAVYPVHTEAVDWISDLKDLGCTACVVLAFLLFVVAWKRRGKVDAAQRGFFVLMAASCAVFSAALFWKETAFVFPVLVAGYVLCFDTAEALWRRVATAAKASAAYWAILAADLVVRQRALGFVATKQRDWQLSKMQTLLSGLDLFAQYWLKLLFPVRLNAYHVFSAVPGLASPRAIAAVLFALALATTIIFGLRRNPLAAFSAFWVCVTIAPVLDPYLVGRNVFTERYLYLPSVGFCLLAVLAGTWAAQRLLPQPRSRITAETVVLCLLLLLFIVQDLRRNAVWKDDATLFTTTLASSPSVPFVEMMVASFQPVDTSGQVAAESHYLRAVSLAEHEVPPDRLTAAIAEEKLASIYANRGDFARALKELDDVRSVDPQDPEVDGESGLILAQAGRWPEAEAALERAVAIEPNNANVLNALGLDAWQYHHDLARAAQFFSRALDAHAEEDDFNASLHSNLGSVYGEQARFSDALNQFQIAVRIEPDEPEYLTNMGVALAATGQRDEAIAVLQRAAQIAPNYEPARTALEQLARSADRRKEE